MFRRVLKSRYAAQSVGPSPVYNVVGVVNSFFMRLEANLELREPERGQGRPAKRDVYRRPLTPRKARQDCHWTKRKLRRTQDSFTGLDQGSSPSNPTVQLSPPTMYSIFNNKP
jgi:hypothetical protein